MLIHPNWHHLQRWPHAPPCIICGTPWKHHSLSCCFCSHFLLLSYLFLTPHTLYTSLWWKFTSPFRPSPSGLPFLQSPAPGGQEPSLVCCNSDTNSHVWGFQPHKANSPPPNSWVSYKSTQFWHYLETTSDQSSKIDPHSCPLKRPISSVDYHLFFWPPGYTLEVPMTFSSSPYSLGLPRRHSGKVPVQGMQEKWVRSLGWQYPLEYKMATHSSILAWKIPWTEEPGGLQSMGSQRVWATKHTSLIH